MINLNLDTLLQGIASVETGWMARFTSLINAAFESTMNPFGSTVVEDAAETGADNVVLINSSGKIDGATIPRLAASKFTSGQLSITHVPDLPATKFTSGVLNSGRLAPGGNTGQVLTKTTTGQEWDISSSNIKSANIPPATANEGTIMFFTANSTGFPSGLYRFSSGTWSSV